MSGTKTKAAKGPAAFTHKPHGGTKDSNTHADERGDGVEKKKRELAARKAQLAIKQAEVQEKAATKAVADAKKEAAVANKAKTKQKR